MITFLFQTAGYRYFGRPFLMLLLVSMLCQALPASAGSPVLTLTCPADMSVQAQPGQCGIYLDFDSLDWNSTVPLSDVHFEPGPGHFLEFGTTAVTLTAISTAGDTATCTFHVTVSSAGTFTLACKNLVPVFIDDLSCEKMITAEMMLLSGPLGCPGQYTIIVIGSQGQNLGNVVDLGYLGQNWTVKVTDMLTGQSCWGQINVKTDSLPPSITCPADLTIYCHEPTDPAFTALPDITGCVEIGLAIEHFDSQTNTFCTGDSIAFQIARTWASTDPYSNVTTCQQMITARRARLDEVVFPPDYDGSQLPPLVCSQVSGPAVLADTSITGVPHVNGHPLKPSNLPCQLAIIFSDSIENTCGAQYILQRTWTVFDFCDDTSISHVQTIVVKDSEPPVFTLPDTLWVNVGAECGEETPLPPIGLLHECSDFEVEITTPWGVLTSNGGMVDIPKVTGTYEAHYLVTDACGNEALDTLVLVVTDGIFSSCPADVELTCGFYLNHLENGLAAGDYAVLQQLGLPTFFANCPFDVEESAVVDVDTCTGGTIHRTMSISTAGGTYACEQTITVLHVSDWVVEFPQDVTIECGETPFDAGAPVVTGEDCERIGVWYNDNVFNVVPDACYKLLRTWHVVNYCAAGNNPSNTIVEKPENKLGLPFPDCDLDGDGDCDARTYRDSWTDTFMPGPADAAAKPWDGYIVHEQVIKVKDNVKPTYPDGCSVPDVCIVGNTCNAVVNLPTPYVEDCGVVTTIVQIRIGGVWVNGFGPHTLAQGTYEVRYTATDACNNKQDCNTTVTVVDCKAPTALCKNSLTIGLDLPHLWAELNAFELNGGSFDNCTSQGFLKYSYSPDLNDTYTTFTCADTGSHVFQLWVTDQAGLQAFCETTVTVIDNSGSCQSLYGAIGGKIETVLGNSFSWPDVHFSDGSVTQTMHNGMFFHPAPQISPITMYPYYNLNHFYGVTTFDAVLLTRHVLGIEYLDSPYKIIAADVNNSGTVTTSDAVEIRKIVLGITTMFPNNTSWRFVPADYVFPNTANPFSPPFPENITVSLPAADPFGNDFIAIKIGDLNLSAGFTGAPDDRQALAGTLHFTLPDRSFEPGETFTLPFVPEAVPLLGFQFALSFDPARLELIDILPGLATAEHFATHLLDQGILKTSWHTGSPLLPEPGQPAFSLVFKAKTSMPPSQWLRLDPLAIAPEAYTGAMETYSVGLVFENSTTPHNDHLLVFPARPNPFGTTTQIGFHLPHAGTVTLTLTDATGRLVKHIQGDFHPGFGAFEVKREDLGPAGLYFYTVRSVWGACAGRVVMD